MPVIAECADSVCNPFSEASLGRFYSVQVGCVYCGGVGRMIHVSRKLWFQEVLSWLETVWNYSGWVYRPQSGCTRVQE